MQLQAGSAAVPWYALRLRHLQQQLQEAVSLQLRVAFVRAAAGEGGVLEYRSAGELPCAGVGAVTAAAAAPAADPTVVTYITSLHTKHHPEQ